MARAEFGASSAVNGALQGFVDTAELLRALVPCYAKAGAGVNILFTDLLYG